MAENNDTKEQPSTEKVYRVNRSVKIALSVAIPMGFLLIFIIIAIALKFKGSRDEKKKRKTDKKTEECEEMKTYRIPRPPKTSGSPAFREFP